MRSFVILAAPYHSGGNMRFLNSANALAFMVAFCAAITGYSAEQEIVSINLEKVFVPKGFDSNDNIEIVVTGELLNTCYVRPYGEVKIEGNRVSIEMKATKLVGPDTACIWAVVPYLVSVPLGQLPQGRYEILVNLGAASQTSLLNVDQPNSQSINNFTYANVTKIEKAPQPREIVIEGVHPSSCMEIERVDIVINENNDTYSVLPIIKQAQPICDRMVKPFSHKVALPATHQDMALVHVRKLDGTAINYLVKENLANHTNPKKSIR